MRRGARMSLSDSDDDESKCDNHVDITPDGAANPSDWSEPNKNNSKQRISRVPSLAISQHSQYTNGKHREGLDSKQRDSSQMSAEPVVQGWQCSSDGISGNPSKSITSQPQKESEPETIFLSQLSKTQAKKKRKVENAAKSAWGMALTKKHSISRYFFTQLLTAVTPADSSDFCNFILCRKSECFS